MGLWNSEAIDTGFGAMTTAADPASSTATSTANVNQYTGVIITLTAAGNAQTIGDPTNTTPGKRFTVVNNDSSTDDIDINGITLEPGEAQQYIWDGTVWVAIEAVDATDITFTPAGDLVATDVQAAIEELDTEKVAKETGKSLVENTEIVKIHTQDTDTYLDKGGANEVNAAEVKGHLGSTYGHPVATASADGFMSKEYAAKVDNLSAAKINYSGYPGEAGFPNGICPEASLPSGMLPLSGYTDPTSPNYGNYIYSDGSIMVYRPQTFIKVGDGTNGLAVNEVDVVPWDVFATESEANDAGYFIHDIFKNDGVLKKGIFRDKYHNSKNALGTGFVASSIKNGLPISTHVDHNPIADLTACSANAYYETINAAHARDGVDGAVNAASIFFVEPRQFVSYMGLTTTAHGQASTADTYCAWYDATGVKNYPKGCNNNALGDTDDGAVSYVSDGYSNCGKAGSGTPFAKTTDNGQECGVADVNGLMWRVNIGMTCITTTASITAATQANPCQITAAGHGKSTGDWVMITGVAGMTELNDKLYKITVVDVNNFTLDGIDATLYTAYTSGGTATFGTFYKKTDAIKYEDFTSGNSLATDHWGATGVAAMMEEVGPEFVSGGFAQRFGNGANQVLSPDVTGNDFEWLQIGLPVSGGASSGGTNLFGSDYFYQYIRNELCVLSGGDWSNGSNAGVFCVYLLAHRTGSSNNVGFACACYPV